MPGVLKEAKKKTGPNALLIAEADRLKKEIQWLLQRPVAERNGPAEVVEGSSYGGEVTPSSLVNTPEPFEKD